MRDYRPAGILLEDDQRRKLAFVPAQDVDAFASLYHEAAFFQRLSDKYDLDLDWTFLSDFVDEEIRVGMARDGWRANQIVDVTRGREERREADERYLSPEYGDAPRNGAVREVKQSAWGRK